MMEEPSIDHFQRWLEQPFQVTLGEISIPMTLVVAEPLPGSQRPAGGFRLEFQGPADPQLPQSIMEVSGPTGRYGIFMVPVGRSGQGTRYEAIFY